MPDRQKQSGMTLLELMLAMMLGLFIVAGVGTVYLGSKQSYATRDQISELDENARMALRVLTEHIEHAGYAGSSGMQVQNYILPSGATVTQKTCGSTQNPRNPNIINSAADGTPGNGGDTIGVSYLADEGLSIDCSGSRLNADCMPDKTPSRDFGQVYNAFRVDPDNFRNAVGYKVPALQCGGSNVTGRQPWAQGVENIQFRYGVDMNGDLAADNYWTATQVQAGNAWNRILSVQVALLMRSIEPVYPDSQSTSYQLLDQTIAVGPDRYKRAVYTTTIRLRNVARRVASD